MKKLFCLACIGIALEGIAAAQVTVFEAGFESAAAADYSTIENINLGTGTGSWVDLRGITPSFNRIRTNSASTKKALLLDRTGINGTNGFAMEARFSQPVSLTNSTFIFDTAVGRITGAPEKNYDIVGEDTNGLPSFHLVVLGGTAERQVAYTAGTAVSVPLPLSSGTHLNPEVPTVNGDQAYNEANMSRFTVATTPANWMVIFDKNRDGTPDWVSQGLPYAGNAVSIARLRFASQVNPANNEAEAGAWLDNMHVTGLPFSGTVTNPPATNSPPAAGTNWNVLMIAIDDLNDWVGAFGGHPQTLTPNMDRLARLGTAFLHAQTAAPACQPSRSALMTGISPATSSLYQNGDVNFRAKPTTQFATSLPQYLKEHGYRIVTSGKIYHNTPDLPGSSPTGISRGATDWDDAFAQGLNLGDPGFNPNANTPGDKFAGLNVTSLPGSYNGVPVPWAPIVVYSSGTNIDRSEGMVTALREGMNDFRVARWAERQITNANTVAKPLFIAAGMTKPHLDWDVPFNYYEKFPVETIQLPVVITNDLDDLSAAAKANGNPEDQAKILNAADPALAWRYAVRAYLAAINFCDEAVGVMLNAVEARRAQFPEEKWMVVLWSDHGWHLGEKARWRKFTLWEESARSISIYWMPGVTTPGGRVEVPVSHMDIYPTVLDFLGLERPVAVQGRSLVPLVRNPALLRDNFPVMCDGEGWHSVRTKRWRYIRYNDGNEELYDHYRDPQEWYNLLHPLNANRIADLQNLTNARRQILTELAKWSVKANSTALFSSPRAFDIAALPTLGGKRVDHFDAVAPGWIQQTGEGSFAVAGGVLACPPGGQGRITAQEPMLEAGQDLFVSARVNFAQPGGSAGLVFGWENEASFYELRVVDGRGTGAGTDVRLLRRNAGTETNLIEIASCPDVGSTNNQPPIPSGWFTVIADYSTEKRALELWVLRPDGAPYWRGEWPLSAPLPAGSRCGIAARDAVNVQVDDFVALAYEPIDISVPDRVTLTHPEMHQGAFRFQWGSVPGTTYRVLGGASVTSVWSQIAAGLPATPPTNFYSVPGPLNSSGFFKVEEE